MLRRTGLVAVLAGALGVPAFGFQQPTFEDQLANLKSPNARTREEAAQALGESRRREAVLPLSTLVRDSEPRVRLVVVRALRQLRDLDGVPGLVTSLGDGDAKVREEAIAGLVEIFAPGDSPGGSAERMLLRLSDAHDRASIAAFVKVDQGVFDGLARRLRDEDARIRRYAALSLGIMGGSSALADLKNSLNDIAPEVRAAAASAIGKVGTVEDGESLIGVLSDESADVRTRSLRSLGVLRVRAAGPTLRQMFDSSTSRDTQLALLETLSRIGDERQIDLFKQLVLDADSAKRRLAVEGLARVADASLTKALKKDFQREKNDELRLAYAFAITKLSDPAFVDTLVLCLAGPQGSRCRGYLIELGPSILPELYPYLGDPDAQIREALCDVAGSIGDPTAVPYLEQLIADPSPKVADRANRAVEHLRRAAASSR